MAPALPAAYLPLRVEGLRLGRQRIDLEVTEAGTSVGRLPDGVRLHLEPLDERLS
jgi:hypothetical protein